MTTAGSHASLADVLARGDTGPVPVPIAIELAIASARALDAASGRPLGLSPGHLAIDGRGFVLVVPGAMVPAYASPEQAAGSGVDARSDVFSLGVIVWELLAGRPYRAGVDVRSQSPGVPAMIAEVLSSALAKAPESRFDNVGAFGRALAGARAATELEEPPGDAIARWVTARVARPSAPEVPDLDLPGSSRMQRSSGQMPAAQPPPTSVRTAAAAAFSDLHLEVAPPLSSRAPPASSRQPPPPSLRPSVPSQVPAHGIDFKTTDDDDDFDMPIERNLVTSAMPPATSSRPSGLHMDGPSSSRHPSGSGLDLGAPGRLSARPARTTSRSREPGFFGKLLGFVVATMLVGATGAALFRFAHHAGGRSVMPYLPHAFDGTSANESGAVAIVSLVVAVTVIFVGLRLRPHAWWVIASGGALLLLALAMVTVTLASTGENPTPPDGALLVPYLLPAAVALLALGIWGRASRIFTRSYGARKVGGVPLAVLAGALAFAAFEISKLAGKI